MVCLFPADRPEAARGFAVAINTDCEGADHGAFDALLVQHLGVQRGLPPQSTRRPDPGDAAWSGLYVADPPRLDLTALPERLFGVWWLRIDPAGHPAGPALAWSARRPPCRPPDCAAGHTGGLGLAGCRRLGCHAALAAMG